MNNSILKHGISAFFIALSLNSCGQGHDNKADHKTGQITATCQNAEEGQTLSIEQGWVRAPQQGQKVTAVYFTICNQAESEDTLLSVSTKRASAAELHETKALENGRVSMQPVSTLIIPPKESVSLEPGGYHIMLIGLSPDAAARKDISIEVTFEKAGTMTALLPLKKSVSEHSNHQGH